MLYPLSRGYEGLGFVGLFLRELSAEFEYFEPYLVQRGVDKAVVYWVA